MYKSLFFHLYQEKHLSQDALVPGTSSCLETGYNKDCTNWTMSFIQWDFNLDGIFKRFTLN